MRRISSLLAGTTLAILAAGTAHAQTAPQPAQPAATADDSGEIVVTARIREERLQDVPVAVSAISGDTLEREQINTIRDAAAFAPGLNITTDAVGRAFMSIRGVGTTLIDSVQPGVGIFVDGIYQPNTSYLNNPVNDVARIEVLKGPQGTLFGNNTLGGAINVITREPTNDFSARLVADYAPDDNYETVSGSISGALVPDALRARLAASWHSEDGFSTNTLAGGDARPLDNQAVNGSLLWDLPNSHNRITVNAYYNRVRGAQTAYSSPAGPTDYVDDVQLNLNSIATYVYEGMNVRGVFDISPNTQMTVIGAVDHKDGTASGDGDFGPVDFVRVRDGHNTLDTYTGELRFDTHWNDRLSTLAGVFADSSDTTNFFVDQFFFPFPFPPPAVIEIDLPNSSTSSLRSWAMFGTAFYNITDSLELTAGLRYDHQTVVQSGTAGRYSADELEPRVTLTQHWSPNHMTYVSVSRGFRGGGANDPDAPNPFYQGDSVWTYELGDKISTSDHRFTLDAAIYYNDYQHYIGQNSLTATVSAPPRLIAVNLNTGAVEAYGAELEGTWRPNAMFEVHGGVAYNHARITDDSDYFNVIGTHLPSDRILFQPDWNAFITPTVTIPLAGSDDIRFNVTAIYKGEREGSSLSPTFSPTLEAYTLVNSNLAYEHDNWTIALWGTNLTDARYYVSYLDQSLLGALFGGGPLVHNLGITGDRRRVGIRVSARF